MAEENAAKEAAPSPSPSSGGKPIILYVLVILNMLVVAGVGFMLYADKQKRAKEPTIDNVIKGEHEAQEHDKQAEEEDFVGKMIPMETFLVNLAGTRGSKLLKVNMELEVEGYKVGEEIDKRKPQIRDMIIIILSSKTYAQLSEIKGKEDLRDEIRDNLNTFLVKGKIKRVHFTEFIFN